MNNKQGTRKMNRIGRLLSAYLGLGLLLFVTAIVAVRADQLAISAINVAVLADNELQIQLEMNGAAVTPQVVKTDNPARIWLDFTGVKNGLATKILPINKGAANSIYIVEAADRLRIVINLLESTPFETKVVNNKVLLTLANHSAAPRTVAAAPIAEKPAPPIALEKTTKPTIPPVTQTPAVVSKPVVSKYVAPAHTPNNKRLATASLIPEQAINGFDFKRGSNGEGRILIGLASPNTVVNTKTEGGKIVLSFANTRLPEHLAKRLDFSEFATPVKYIEATSSDKGSTVTVSTQNNLYDYSLFQSDGLLTVEFRPLTHEEKDALERSRVKYTGERLSLNFQEIDVRSVIAILAEFTGQNVVAGDDVTGTITLKLDDVPWDEALDFVMMTKDLGKFETGNVTLISPLDKIKSYKEKQQETERVVAQLDPLITEYIKISYSKAAELKKIITGQDTAVFGSCGNTEIKSTVSVTKTTTSSGSSSGGSGSSPENASTGSGAGNNKGQTDQAPDADDAYSKINGRTSLLSKRGSVFVDSRTNMLIVHDTPKQLEEIKKLIRKLDVPVRQVMIEARIVNATNGFMKELGVKFGAAKQAVIAGAGTLNPTSFGIGGAGTRGSQGLVDSTGNVVSAPGVYTPADGNGTPNNMLVDLGAAAAASSGGALAMTLARGADYVLNLELSAAQTKSIVEVLANPRVMTADRCIATIKQGVQLPYTTSSTTGNSVVTMTVFQNADLQLDVLPQITPDGNVIMSLRISNDTQGALTPSNQFAINTEQLQTNVQVLDGETVVLGGVFGQRQNDAVAKVPFFGDLPGVGFLFRHTTREEEKKELLIFITPKVIKNETVVD